MGRSPTQWGTPQSRRAGGPAPRGALLVPATSRHVHVHVPVALQAEAAICENNRLLFIAAHNVGPPEIWIGGLCQVSVLLNACSICQSSSCQQQRQARLRRWRCLSCARWRALQVRWCSPLTEAFFRAHRRAATPRTVDFTNELERWFDAACRCSRRGHSWRGHRRGDFDVGQAAAKAFVRCGGVQTRATARRSRRCYGAWLVEAHHRPATA